MDNKEKLRVLLQHWIEHNQGHVSEFTKWQKIMAADKMESLSEQIKMAAEQMDQVSDILAKALDFVGGPTERGGHHHHHHD
ncbi:MAG: hypothetical protein HKP41_07350 [Desulfobacterales bacterium]|nr:hypothetical protein [Deltaproteobacteria bacterium]NNK94151.1 hypothetical protein [Desulfobacterales bacterium]